VPQARDLLQSLVAAFSGAVAIVTGRRISEIDHYLAPLQLPVAGLYGLVRRSADSNIRDATADVASVARASAHLKAFAELHPELLLELKGQTIALHYRTRPELAAKVREAGRAALRGLRDLKLIEGKMVVEIAPSTADKGRAVGEFLDEAPFVGRRPIYCGDDISDEAAFNAVRARGGITVKIGTGPTCAQFRAHNIEELFAWFEAVCKIGPQPE
jgi:trehalose 6-phosphate phosphatase